MPSKPLHHESVQVGHSALALYSSAGNCLVVSRLDNLRASELRLEFFTLRPFRFVVFCVATDSEFFAPNFSKLKPASDFRIHNSNPPFSLF